MRIDSAYSKGIEAKSKVLAIAKAIAARAHNCHGERIGLIDL
jgi:hypothetical protein